MAKKNEVLILQNKSLEEEVTRFKLKETSNKIKEVNKSYSKPTSKQPEWEKKGVGNDCKEKKKGRVKKGRKGSGNKAKNRPITRSESCTVETCDFCGKDLSGQLPLESKNTRIIEDIPEIPVELEVIEVVQEKKYCSDCKKVTTANSELALQKSDFGLNTTIAIIYLWIASCLSFPRISSYLNTFYGQQISTSGLSQHVIRISKIMSAVYAEILEDIKKSGILQADETGWRVNGINWWLWVFGTLDSAYYTIDKSRGKDVVRRILGEIFIGVLVVDGWSAYLSLICKQQSCMAHLLRKILRDGERLQKQHIRTGKPMLLKTYKEQEYIRKAA